MLKVKVKPKDKKDRKQAKHVEKFLNWWIVQEDRFGVVWDCKYCAECMEKEVNTMVSKKKPKGKKKC